MNKQICVIIPTYKPQDYLPQCLESVYNQTLSKDNYEVIIILNGEKEPYYTQICDFIDNHPFVFRLLYNNQAGVSAARNIGLTNTNAEYITFIDDDDYVSSTYLEQLLKHASKDTIALPNIIAFDAKHNKLPYRITNDFVTHSSHGKQKFYFPRRYYSIACCKLIHRDLINDRRFNTNFANGEDSLFIFLISDKMKYSEFTNSNAIYYRRIRPGSANSNLNTFSKRIKHVSRMITETIHIYTHNPKEYNFWFFCTRIAGMLRSLI